MTKPSPDAADDPRGRAVAVVLAGGVGRRLGGHLPGGKAALPLAGRTFLDRVLDAVSEHVAHVIVVAAPDQPLPTCRHACDVTRDTRPGAGPLAALADGLARAGRSRPTARYAVVVSCDVPLLQAKVVRVLLEEVARPGCRWAVPRIGGHLQPLVSALAIDCLADVERRLATGARDLRGLVEDLRRTAPGAVVELDAAVLRRCDPRLESFLDVDTPADLAALVDHQEPPTPPA